MDKVPEKVIATVKEKFLDAEALNTDNGQVIYNINLKYKGQKHSVESTIVAIEEGTRRQGLGIQVLYWPSD